MAAMHVERVGGGYSYGVDPYGGSPRRPRPVAPKGAVSCVVKDFEAEGVRAIEVLQGGATVWTAEEDGSIKLRNGFTGEVAHTVPAKGAGLVERLYASQDLMWVGLNDGSVRVYDHLVVDHEWPSAEEPEKPHTGPVRFFCPLYDDSMLSGSTDGLIIKWAGAEPSPYTHVAKARPSTSLTALEAYSTFVFAGDLQGNIYVMTSDTLEVVRTFEAHPSATVTCLKYMDGVLFSGGSDGKLRAWSQVTQRDPDMTEVGDETWHDVSIRRLVGDPRSHQMWSIDESGRIHKWESTAPFAQRNAIVDQETGDTAALECGSFHDLTTFASWDAVRVWSTGSNGANFSWFAQWSRAEEQMQEAIRDMNIVIETDQTRLATWQADIDKISEIDERRKRNLAHAMAANTEKGVLYLYLRKWHAWLRKSHEVKRRLAVAQCLERTTDGALRRIYFDKLYNFLRGNKQARQKQAMLENILCTTERGLRHTYWKKINQYRQMKKKEQHRQDLADTLMRQSDVGLLRIYYRKLHKYPAISQMNKKRVAVAEALLRAAGQGVQRLYYFKLVRYLQVAKRLATKRTLAEVMGNANSRGMQRVYFHKFMKWGSALKSREQQRDIANMLKSHQERNLLAIYQQKADEWLGKQTLINKTQEVKDKTAKHEDLLQQQEKEKARMKRLEALEQMRKRRDDLKKKRDMLKEKLQAVKDENDELKDRVQVAAKREEQNKATREKLKDTMAKLKQVALNFDSDHQLIITTTDKCMLSPPLPSPPPPSLWQIYWPPHHH